MSKLKVLDLFAGIGGFSLGLEATGGFETVAFVEIDSYCRKVLRKHWPDAQIHADVTKFNGKPFRNSVDVITGGFPCQDISSAGSRAGIKGGRSGLWYEYLRLIREIRPRWTVIENVTNLLSGGKGLWFEEILRGLWQIRLNAEWHCIPASAIGAPHRRDRVWIICRNTYCGHDSKEQARYAQDTNSERNCGRKTPVADTDSSRLAQRLFTENGFRNLRQEGQATPSGSWWTVEPNMGRMANGVPRRVDRLRCLGNAIVPQIATLIGEAILASIDRDSDHKSERK